MHLVSEGSTAKARFVALIVGLLVVAVLFGVAEFLVRERQGAKHGFATMESIYTVDRDSGLKIPIANASFGNIRINSFRNRNLAGCCS